MMSMGYGYGRRARIESAFEEYCTKGRRQYGAKFDPSGLADKYVGYYNSGERITVGFVDGDGQVFEVKTGTVGVTGGHKPSFMLMLTKRSTGSSYLLGVRDVVLRDGDLRATVIKARVKRLRKMAVVAGVVPPEPPCIETMVKVPLPEPELEPVVVKRQARKAMKAARAEWEAARGPAATQIEMFAGD